MKKQSIFLLILLISGISTFGLQKRNGHNNKKYVNLEGQKSEAYIKGNIYQKDYLLLISLLKDSHPAFADKNTYPFNIDSLKKSGYEWAEECDSKEELWSYMQGVMTLLNDGHTTLKPEFNSNAIYPIVYFIDDNDLHIASINKEYKSFLGKQVSKINGYNIDEIFSSFKQLISSDNDIYFKSKVGSFMQLHSMWQHTPYCRADSSLQLTFKDGTNTFIKPVAKNKLNIVSQQIQNNNKTIRKNYKVPFHYTLVPEKGICYFQFNACFDQNSLRQQYLSRYPNIPERDLQAKTSRFPRFDKFLSGMFDSIRVNGIETLVIDVRDNKGGNSNLCNQLLSWLMPADEIKNISSYIRFSELWKQNYPTLASTYEDEFVKAQKSFKMGELHSGYTLPSLSKSISENKSDNNFPINSNEALIFKGKVVFIQNSNTYSSAGMLITTAMDNNIGIVIGDKSSYKPCSCGDLLSFELPNTKIKGFVSHKIFKRPNISQCNIECLVPDVLLQQTWNDFLEGKDIYWNWVLENYTDEIELYHSYLKDCNII
ncbi:hypothetical protein K4L44_13810 [Halosquirtibacter laminarini]|uniref:Uncharacterized protein n=1 Tax=Halosquirtibacter laminarini TaxID=3374600 RepID=A0AC61NNX2_9BACT|nr:hypothetical protein K4L44_13810 [Prolixibacteraceae bacterium]